jgi:glycosyltransferase involved in cell wall biosynthesis
MPEAKSVNKKKSHHPYLSVVLPVFNEEKNIKLQYELIIKALKPLNVTYEVIFIDDGSIDASPDILRNIAKKDKNIKLVIFRRNFGQTAAMSAGIDYAAGEIIVFMDSDLQNDPGDIGMLFRKIEEGYDVVSGWRKKRKDKFLSRRLPSKVANWLIARVTGVRLHDLGCSLKAYRSNLLKQVNLYGEMHRFIPVHASWIGAKITEVQVAHHPRKYGRSKYGIIRTFKVLMDLITVTFLGKYSTKPIYFFGGTGFFLFILSLLSGLAVILMKIFFYQSMTRNPLLILTVMLIILSVLFIQIGILAEILIRIYHESQGKQPYSVLDIVNVKKR